MWELITYLHVSITNNLHKILYHINDEGSRVFPGIMKSILYVLFIIRDFVCAFISANLQLLFLGVGLEGLCALL